MKGRIEYEFEVDFNRGKQHDLDIFEFIEESSSFDFLTLKFNINKNSYKNY